MALAPLRQARKALKRRLRVLHDTVHARGKPKIFCVGRNKTGTTSLQHALLDLGITVGDQRAAEELARRDYHRGEFAGIIAYCRTAQAFQDAPFSYPHTYRHVDAAWPGSRFILTVRDDAEQWYRSFVAFHSKLWGKEGRVPTAEDLKAATYLYKGSPYVSIKRMYGTPDDDLYRKDVLIDFYLRHNQAVADYFRDRPGDLLVLNVAEKDSYRRFVEFLGLQSPHDSFPWMNRTGGIDP